MQGDVIALRRSFAWPQQTQHTVRSRMVLHIPRPWLKFRPPVTAPVMCPQCGPDRHQDTALPSSISLPSSDHLSKWMQVLRQIQCQMERTCPSIWRHCLHCDSTLGRVASSVQHIGTPLTSTVFLCKGFEHARAGSADRHPIRPFLRILGTATLQPSKQQGICTDFGWIGLRAIVPSLLMVLPEQLALSSLVTSIDFSLSTFPPPVDSSPPSSTQPLTPHLFSSLSTSPRQGLGNFLPSAFFSSPASAACRSHPPLASARPQQCPSFHVNQVLVSTSSRSQDVLSADPEGLH
eukprot:3578588-Rhodomonas_salina.2